MFMAIHNFPSSTRAVQRALLVLALCIVGLGLLPVKTAQAAATRCFAETGFCVSGPILDYWERNGGLPVFGYPISDQHTETVEGTWTGPVQWFERDRLEDHSREGQGVLAGRLGARWLDLQGKPWQTFPGAPGPGDPNQCRFFSETGHILCGRFRTYWERNGGLARFGYPITEVFNETVEGRSYAVQYFERRRMEYHPEHAGTPHEVLLGLLGRDVRKRGETAWFFSPAPKYAPLAPSTTREGAAQRFERGFMLWTREPDQFWIFVDNGPFYVVNAPYTFQPGAAVPTKPPAGRFAPSSGFGRLWRGEIAVTGPGPLSEPVHKLLGWAVEPEHPYTTGYQCHGGAHYSEQRCYFRGAANEIVWIGPPGWGRWP